MKLKTRTIEILSEAEMDQIWETALQIWPKVPLRAAGNEEFTQAVVDFGCKIDGNRIWLPESVREKVLERVAQERERRGPPRPAEVENDKIGRITNGQAFYCCGIQSGEVRPATTQDLAQWSRVCDTIPDLQRAHPTYIPQDVPIASCDVHTFATVILNSRRPCRVSVFDADMLPFFIQLQAICDGGTAAVRLDPIFNVTCYASSPSTISHEAIEVAMRARRSLGKPFTISAMPVVGSATPTTLAGSLAQSTAECLTMNAITLAVDDRLNGWMESPTVMDMRSGMAMISGPDFALVRLAYAQMAAYVFGGTYSGTGSLSTTSPIPGPQAAIEKCLDAMWGFCNGVRSFSSLGILGCSDAAGVTQLMIDLEIVSHFERLARGISVDEDRLAADLITEVAPRGAYYLGEPHTASHFRQELWTPDLMVRRSTMAWITDPSDMLDNARKKALQVVEGAENQCPLDDSQRSQVAEILKEADAVAQEKTSRTRVSKP
ncbi:MAG: trimethylamine methyltransferase family protein [Candidatus Latescibacteria bacterium]|jgi:trimethylamine--corrinoid protein Co-methyltransferase|nr:trimethylamine methyltransferase family protein [Candidatus Latescibacterota bacterium]